MFTRLIEKTTRQAFSRPALVVLTAIALTLVLALTLIWHGQTSRKTSVDQGSNTSLPASRPPLPLGEQAATSLPAEALKATTQSQLELLEELAGLGQAGTRTVDDLLKKGLPLVTSPRRYVCEHTARQSIPELVADLGYRPTIHLSSITSEGMGSSYYHVKLMRHVKVIRLIEEGRQQPDVVAPLCVSSLRASLDSYDKVRAAEDVEIKKLVRKERPPPRSSDKDAYYDQYRRYEDPILEFARLEDVIYSDFYILLSIGRPASPNLVAEWVAKAKRPGWMRKDIDMNLWLISESYRDGRLADTPEARRFAAALADWQELGRRTRVSRWNALWDIQDPLLGAAKADTSGIPVLEVPRIPRHKASLSYEEKETLLRDFISVVDRLCR